MYAGDIAQPCRTLPLDGDALEAVQTLAFGMDPYLVLADSGGVPQQVLQGTEFVRAILPEFVVVQPGLAALFGFDGRERLHSVLAGKRTGDCLPPAVHKPLTVGMRAALPQVMIGLVGRDTQLAVVMGREHGAEAVKGVITARGLLHHLLMSPGRDQRLNHIPVQP